VIKHVHSVCVNIQLWVEYSRTLSYVKSVLVKIRMIGRGRPVCGVI
jgi:hypothetical protein